MINVAIVDNYAPLRKAFSLLLSRHHDLSLLSTAENGQIFIQQLQAGTILPDVAVLDINMPVMDGFATTAFLRKHFPSIKILVVSMSHDKLTVDKILRLGAGGYVTKGADAETYIDAIRAVANNETFIHNEAEKSMLHNW